MRKKKHSHNSRNTIQQNSIGDNALHFFSCEEPARIKKIKDIVGGVELSIANNPNLEIAVGGSQGINVNMQSIGIPSTQPDSGSWESIGVADWAIFSCGTCINEGVEDWDGGAINLYFGSVSQGQLRVQPYFAVWKKGDIDAEAGNAFNQIGTPVYYPMMRRTEGETYIIAAVKRGRYLEHWVDGVLRGVADTELILESVAQTEDAVNKAKLQALYDTWNNHESSTSKDISFGHSAYNTVVTTYTSGVFYLPHLALSEYPHHDPADQRREVPESFSSDTANGYDGGVVNLAQDFYGFLVHKYPSGIPDTFGDDMLEMKANWVAGNKILPEN